MQSLCYQDYQEEISVAKENKHQLEQMGERLAQASHENKAAEIQYKLSKVNERWQHLLDLIEARWVFQMILHGVVPIVVQLFYIYSYSCAFYVSFIEKKSKVFFVFFLNNVLFQK